MESSKFSFDYLFISHAYSLSSEPEFRLVFMAPALITFGLGAFLYGYTMHVGSPGPLCALFWGVMQTGVVFGLSSTTSYALDAFRSESNEIFIIAMLFKVSSPAHPRSRLRLTRPRISCSMDLVIS